MFVGFDYGTSNCAIAAIDAGRVRVLPLEGDSPFVPSALYALDRSLIVEAVNSQIADGVLRREFAEHRVGALRQAAAMRRELALAPHEPYWFMGREAIANYVEYPGEGWFVKSPKSYLGAAGLSAHHLHFLEDTVTLMMQHLKARAEQHCQADCEQAVIGRPINFQGIDQGEANRVALAILSQAAKRAGFKEVEFFYEPLAAGMEFETQLEADKSVLVLDVGGGTSDCSMLRMGPSYIKDNQRERHVLAHQGLRVGGNDLDINLTFANLMILFGRNTALNSGLPLPAEYFSLASQVNDVNAQARFYSADYATQLRRALSQCQQKNLLQRLLNLQTNRQGFQLVLAAEQLKIALSFQERAEVDLSFIEASLHYALDRSDFLHSVASSLNKISALLQEVVAEAGETPDTVFLTGGSAKSPLLRQLVEQRLGAVPVVNGDDFGSVVSGLARRAEQLFS